MSDGITNRNPLSVTWNVLSVDSITTSAEKVALDTLINTQFSNLRSMTLNETTIQTYQGKIIEIQVSIQNFLGNSGTNSLKVKFLGKFYIK